jgi:hypothetical protein
MPAMVVPRGTANLIESTVVSGKHVRNRAMLQGASLQNPTEWRRDSPFFGSDFGRFLVEGHRSPAINRNRDREVREVRFDLWKRKWKYRYFGF